MIFSLIICTYKRHIAIVNLLNSVAKQTVYPDEILVIDGSDDDLTKNILVEKGYKNLIYYKVEPKDRGLTKQRNFGISKVNASAKIVCFLDDDTVLEQDYFKNIIKIYAENSSVVGVGGIAINENSWQRKGTGKKYNKNEYYEFEGFVYKESSRNVLRNKLGLASNEGAGKMPEYSHGRTCGFPITGKYYEVDLLIGMSMSFRKIVFDNIGFSTYFEGYGLYEDADFSLRALQFGKNVIATNVQLNHYHDRSGRPNKYIYGKMVVRNGWYVWRVKNLKPSLKAKIKWHSITILLTLVRFTNVITTSQKKEALTEAWGRTVGWGSLTFNKPKIEK